MKLRRFNPVSSARIATRPRIMGRRYHHGAMRSRRAASVRRPPVPPALPLEAPAAGDRIVIAEHRIDRSGDRGSRRVVALRIGVLDAGHPRVADRVDLGRACGPAIGPTGKLDVRTLFPGLAVVPNRRPCSRTARSHDSCDRRRHNRASSARTARSPCLPEITIPRLLREIVTFVSNQLPDAPCKPVTLSVIALLAIRATAPLISKPDCRFAQGGIRDRHRQRRRRSETEHVDTRRPTIDHAVAERELLVHHREHPRHAGPYQGAREVGIEEVNRTKL